MGDLREELIRLAETWETKAEWLSRHDGGSGAHARRLNYREVATALRSLLASHPAPSPRSEAPALPVRNTSTEEGRQFWASAEQAAAEVESWPDWKRAGINEAESRARARSEAGGGPCCVDRARRGWCDCARAPVPAESATKGEEDGR